MSINIRRILKDCCVAALVVLVFVGLGPPKWQPRSGLGWEIDHFAGYLVITLMFCIAWPRPLVVAATLIAAAVLLEALQALTPDRCSDFFAVLCGASGAAGGAVVAVLVIR